MKRLTPILVLGASLAFSSLANATGFDSDLATTITGPIKVEVVVSEDLAHRAEHLPKKLSDRGSSRRLNAAFANNGKFGQRDVDRLVEELNEELAEDFEKYGIIMSDDAPTLLRVTLEKVKPNRPTFRQLSVDSSLSFKSFGIGGAEITAEVIGAGGKSLGTMEYDYYSNFQDIQIHAVSTWYDANRSISRFSKRASKKLAALGASDQS